MSAADQPGHLSRLPAGPLARWQRARTRAARRRDGRIRFRHHGRPGIRPALLLPVPPVDLSRPRRARRRVLHAVAAACLGAGITTAADRRRLLLVAVLIPGVGHEVNGATRWLRLGPLNLQASEPARLLLVIYLCSYVARRRDALESGFKGLLFPLVIVTAAGMLLMLQPDFGATAVLFVTAIGVLFVGGMRLGYLLVMGIAGLASLGLLVLTSEYRMRRLTAFLDPLGRSVEFGLPAYAVADRDRPRRVVRRRARRQRAEALLPPGGAHGLRVRGVRRGIRAVRRIPDDRAVHGGGVARLPDQRRGCGGRTGVRPASLSDSAPGSACRPSSTSP
jgi:hypothetical protein